MDTTCCGYLLLTNLVSDFGYLLHGGIGENFGSLRKEPQTKAAKASTKVTNKVTNQPPKLVCGPNHEQRPQT